MDNLDVIHELELTDEYIHKLLPFKIQNMIDDTLINCLGKSSL